MNASSRFRFGNRRGQALVEFALILPLLTLVLFGLIEFGGAIDAEHSISTLSREGANLASRGTPLDTVTNRLVANGTDINLASLGGVVATQIDVVGGTPFVQAQSFSTGFARPSKIGQPGDTAFAFVGLNLLDGSTHYVVEVFYNHVRLTPLRSLFTGLFLPDTLYERALF